MPKFILNKLVRDKLIQQYQQDGQKAVVTTLADADLLAALKQKIIEEAQEIPLDGNRNDLVSEIADIQQALDDFKAASGVTDEQVNEAQQVKLKKKGGFLGGSFISTLELSDNDEWLEYYRARPQLFTEIDENKANQAEEVLMKPGLYKHYKGNEYEVIGVGRHTETDERIVVYRPLYNSEAVYWLRPYSMFIDSVTINGVTQPRFMAM